MQAMPVWDWGSAQDIKTAQDLLKQAIAIDPDYPRANSLLAWACAAHAQLGSSEARALLDAAGALAQRAIERDPEDPGRISPQAMSTWSRAASTPPSGS